jgi:hypothetical protein
MPGYPVDEGLGSSMVSRGSCSGSRGDALSRQLWDQYKEELS